MRWNSPYINHFISPDSIVPNETNPQSWDRYSYVGNNPVRYTDPSGHMLDEGEMDGKPGCSNLTYCRGGKPKPFEELSRKRNDGLPCSTCHGQSSQQPNQQSLGCTSTHPCLMPKPENPSWWDLDPTNPDYYVLSVSAGPPGLPGLTVTLTMDRYKNIYGGLGGNYGKSMESFSASFTGGSIGSPFDEQIPDPVNIESFLTDWAVNGGVGAAGGGGITYSPGANQTFISRRALEYGIFLPPSIGLSDVHSWKLGNPFIAGDQ